MLGPGVSFSGPRVVLEIGTVTCRGGLAGRHHPHFVIPTPVNLLVSPSRANYLEFLTKLFVHYLQLRPKDCQVVIVEKNSAVRLERALLQFVLLKDLQVNSLTMQIDMCMSLLASGSASMTGLVIDIGNLETRMIAFAFGRPVQQSFRIVGIGVSHAFDAFLVLLLSHLGLPQRQDQASNVELKSLFEKAVNASPDNQDIQVNPKQSLHGKTFILPASVRRAAAETLIFGRTPVDAEDGYVNVLHTNGLAGAIVDCVSACNHDIRRACTANVVLSGGGAMISHLSEELCKEANKLLGTDPVLIPAVSAFSADSMAWTGASLFATLKSSQARFVGAQYAEKAPPDWMSLDPQDWTYFAPT